MGERDKRRCGNKAVGCLATIALIAMIAGGVWWVGRSGHEKQVAAQKTIKVDWTAAIEKWESWFSPAQVPSVIDSAAKVNESSAEITLNAVVADGMTSAQAVDLADSMIRQFSLACTSLNPSLESATKYSYGEVFDVYSASINVVPFSAMKDEANWLVESYVVAGMHTKQAPKAK